MIYGLQLIFEFGARINRKNPGPRATRFFRETCRASQSLQNHRASRMGLQMSKKKNPTGMDLLSDKSMDEQMWIGNLLTSSTPEWKASPIPSKDGVTPTPSTAPSSKSSTRPAGRFPPGGQPGEVLALACEVTTVTEQQDSHKRTTRDVKRTIKWTTDGLGTKTVEKRERFIDGVLEKEVIEASDNNNHVEASEEDILNFDRIWDREKAFIPVTMDNLV